MAEKFSTGYVQAQAAATNTALANFVIGIYGGTQPAAANDTEGAAPLLALITLAGGAFTGGVSTNGLNWDSPADGVLTKPSAADWQGDGTVAAGTGTTATWFRVYDNSYTTGADTTSVRYDGAISTAESAELRMTNTTIVQNVPVVIANPFTLTSPKSA